LAISSEILKPAWRRLSWRRRPPDPSTLLDSR
jgi:hypothetical protein